MKLSILFRRADPPGYKPYWWANPESLDNEEEARRLALLFMHQVAKSQEGSKWLRHWMR